MEVGYSTHRRGKKRQRSIVEDEDEAVTSSDLEQSSQSKRRRTSSGNTGFFGAFVYAVKTVYSYFCPKKEMESDQHQRRNDLNVVQDDDKFDDEIRIVHDSREKKRKDTSRRSKHSQREDPDDIQVLEEVITSPEMATIRFQPPGHSTILSSTLKKTRPCFVVTKQKREKDRKDRNKPGSILDKINDRKITATTAFELSPASWRTPYAHGAMIRKSVKRNRALSGTPKSYMGKSQWLQTEDLQKYKSVLAKILSTNVYNGLTVIDKSSALRSPIFPKTKAIEMAQLNNDDSRSLIARMKLHQKRPKQIPEVITIDDDPIPNRPREGGEDNDIIEIIDAVSPPKSPKPRRAKMVPTMNTLEVELDVLEVTKPSYLDELKKKYVVRSEDRSVLIAEEQVKAKYAREHTDRLAKSIEDRLKKHLAITEVAIPEPEDESEDEEPTELPDLTDEMETEIDDILSSPVNKTLVDAHNIAITRKDLDTLRGLNWLNDEIINFYMQMIVARSSTTDNWPKVYAMNTFFLPKLRDSGYATLKRWTRKVDIFSYDVIIVPVHLDVHWCLAVINLKKKGVYFYDSMGSDKPSILKLLLHYLEQESLDKKKAPFDTSGFEMENVKDIPRQMNGSDCGVFTLKYAEYLSRNASITFTQEHMPYYRRRMVYEIVKNNLIHP